MINFINTVLSFFGISPNVTPMPPINTSNDTEPIVQPIYVPTASIQPIPVIPVEKSPFIDPKLIHAIIMVESEGNDNAIGDLHLTDHAYGCMQIRQGVVDQVNAKLGTHYKSQDCLGNRNLSILMFTIYYQIFSHLVTNEDRAKGWNGGGGWKQFYGKPGYEKYSSNLDIYWKKVQQYLV